MAWMDRQVVVELDSYGYHRTRAAFARDRSKDGALQLAGFRVIRVTQRRLEVETGEVVAALEALRGN
jgi:very-short-patch-repair endonuclease